jgi:hypothetical protein
VPGPSRSLRRRVPIRGPRLLSRGSPNVVELRANGHDTITGMVGAPAPGDHDNEPRLALRPVLTAGEAVSLRGIARSSRRTSRVNGGWTFADVIALLPGHRRSLSRRHGAPLRCGLVG